jgi:hypothetical protein
MFFMTARPQDPRPAFEVLWKSRKSQGRPGRTARRTRVEPLLVLLLLLILIILPATATNNTTSHYYYYYYYYY